MKYITEEKLIKEAASAVSQCFSDVPSCKFELSECQAKGEDRYIDLIGNIRFAGKKVKLLIEIKNSGQPRFVREAAVALAMESLRFKGAYGVLVAPFLSDEAARILASKNLGYVDLAGNCRISVDGIYIRKEGRANRFTQKRDLRSLYSPKAERVLRALMSEPRRVWKIKELSEQAQVSLGQASNVKKLLDAREWLGDEDIGFSLKEPEKLLAEWSVNYQFQRNQIHEYYSPGSIAENERQVAELRNGKCFGALTGFSAAARLAPAVRYQRMSAFVHEPSKDVANKLGWKAVASGGNVTLIEPYDEGVFLETEGVDGLQMVSAIQAYLDLHATAGRGEEAAEALLREVLQPSW